jgi:hypothetical protein
MTINIDEVKEELGAYNRKHSKEVMNMIYRTDVQIDQYCKKITMVQGRFPAFHAVASHVIQGFVAEWNELGATQIRVNELISYHHKVNYPIVPAEILNSWLADMYDEDKPLDQKSISRYIMMEHLSPKVLEDLQQLSGDAVYDANRLNEFGFSMNGWKKILADALADADKPVFKIPLTALTEENIVDQVTAFEKAIPVKLKSKITKIFMPTKWAEEYLLQYEDQYGANTLAVENDKVSTRLKKRKIVGLDCLGDTDYIFATVDGNMLKLINLIEKPVLTDIQKDDYKLKLFMEFWLGYGFWVNPLVLMADYEGGHGLGSDALNELYYPGEIESSGSGSGS